MALGNFNALLKAVNQDPAMLRWLDGDLNRAGKPNETFSRELMELFTLGIGHYTETDVREGARALTGWTINGRAFQQNGGALPIEAIFRPRLHDTGVKTYLGHTGNLGSDDVMNMLSAHPATGGFLAYKLFAFFANDNPDKGTLQPFIDTYYKTNYDMKAVVRQILLSDAFYTDQSFQQHFKSPVEFVIGAVRELGLSVPVPQMVRVMALMGQDLFNPPNVGGWTGGLTWANESTLVERFNFAGQLSRRQNPNAQGLNGAIPATEQNTPPSMSPGTAFSPQQIVRQSGAQDTAGLVDYLLNRFIGVGATPSTRAALIGYLGGNSALSPQLIQTKVRSLMQLVLSTPEYQLN
jgi:uncharacterized protein (DUF1800 family)